MRQALALILMLLILQVAGGTEYTRTVNASDILANISKGQTVEYDNVIVKGNLSLENLKGLPTMHVNRTEYEIELCYASRDIKKVVSPIKIKNSLITGMVSFNNTVFENAIDFGDTKFDSYADFSASMFNNFANFTNSRFDSLGDFTDSKFNNDVCFDSSIFSEDAYFESSIFNGVADFGFSRFNNSSSFSYSNFNSDTNFSISNFNGNASFHDSKFNGFTNFIDSKFNGFADFGFSKFNSDTDFQLSSFNGFTNFDSSMFNGNAYFDSSTFNGFADFGFSRFNGDGPGVYFIDSKFDGYAYFCHSKFNSNAFFSDSIFQSQVDFSDSFFNSSADFSNSDFNNSTAIDNAIFQKVATFSDSKFRGDTSFNRSQFREDALFEGAKFNCTLYLTRTKYDKLYLRWGDINDLAYDDATYLSLLENFKKLGYIEDYDNCYYAYRKEHRDQGWRGTFNSMSPTEEWIRKRIDSVLEISYGYGKKPLYPLGWSIVTIILFGTFWGIKGQGRREIASDEYSFPLDQVSDGHHKMSLWDNIHLALKPFIFSATIFLSGTRLFVDPPEVPELPGTSKSLIKGIFTLERVLGAFFSILLFIAIGATVIR
jgi:hypothetical protein